MRSFYDILEVSPSASTAEIRASYLKLAREYHPDRVPEYLTKLRADAEEKVKEINEAWAVLSDPGKRRKYDLKVEGNAVTSSYSSSTANPARPAARRPPLRIPALLEWLRTRKDVLRWALVIGISTLVLVVVGELIALRGIKSQSAASQPGVAVDGPGPQRIIRYDLKPVQFQTAQFAGRNTITFHSFSISLSESKSVATFQVSSADRHGFLLYEPPGGSTRTRNVMGKTVVVDRGFEEPYLIDDGGRKYYSTSGLIGGEQVNFDLYNFTRRINVTSQKDLTLSAEFPPLDQSVSSVTFVLPALGKWQPEWRFPRFDLR
jgi:hypothetical protein